jgi:4-hydroxy-tetrahydrodipicolinate synthase
VTAAPPLARGLWVILTTPFDDRGALDVASTQRQVRFAKEAGADGVVALGVFGEGASLSLAEQRRVAATVAAEAGGTPLLLGVSARSTAVAVEQGQSALDAAREAGAVDATLMVQINSPAPDVVAAHLTAIHESTGAGIVLQDYPVASGVHMPGAAVERVLEACPFVVAVKAEAPPTPVAIAALTARAAVPVFGGLGGVGLVDELATGAAGAMTGFSHPEGLRATIDAFEAGGFEAARRTWAPWLPLANFEAQQGIALSLRKTLLHRRGVLDSPLVRPPAVTMPDSLSALLDQHLAAAPSIYQGAR